jgi:hypothetical protein
MGRREGCTSGPRRALRLQSRLPKSLIHGIARPNPSNENAPGFRLYLVNDTITAAVKLHPVEAGIPLHGDAVERERFFGQFGDGLIGVKPCVFVELSKLPAGAGQNLDVPR